MAVIIPKSDVAPFTNYWLARNPVRPDSAWHGHGRYGPLTLALVGVLSFCVVTASSAAGRFTYKEKVFPSAAAACAQLLRDLTPPESLKTADPPDEDGNVHCVGAGSDQSAGFDMYSNEVHYERESPNEPRGVAESEKASQEDAKPEPPTATTAASGALPNSACSVGGPISDEQKQALRQWMGKKFTDVPSFEEHWNDAAKDKIVAVSTLKPDPKTNQANREKYFNPVRKQFWRRVYRDERENGAKKLIEKAGGVFTEAGKPPRMTINGRTVILDVDHIIGLAVDPSKMLAPSNLQLISSIENQKTLEEIKREDPFQSPQAEERWMRKQNKEGCK